MKHLFAAVIGLSAACVAAPASALALYDARGELFLVFAGGPNIEAAIEIDVDGGSGSIVSGSGLAIEDVDFLDGSVGLEAFVRGSSDAPFGSSENNLFLDVSFIITNTGPINVGQTEGFEGFFAYDFLASASTDLPGEAADAFLNVTSQLGFVDEVGAFVEATELDSPAEDSGPLAEIFGELLPGESARYAFIFDLGGQATTPRQPGGAEVPLPAAGALMILGLGALAATRRRRKG